MGSFCEREGGKNGRKAEEERRGGSIKDTRTGPGPSRHLARVFGL